MENDKSLVKAPTNEMRLPTFVENAYESLDSMNQFAEILLQSKLLPIHFYEKGADNKPDYNKGKAPALVAVLIQGYQLQLPPLTAAQHIVPVNGLLSIKGDMAKSLIFNSGKLQQGSWIEEESGSLETSDFRVKITATRADNGMKITRSFSIADAKRAGLWITDAQVNAQDGWKYKQSAWYKFPLRMIYYRALGFLARDAFSDVLMGVYTTEEAMDMPKDFSEIIETSDGNKIIIPDKQHSEARSAKMTSRVSDKIPDKQYGAVSATIPEATVINETNTAPVIESPFIPSKGSVEFYEGKPVQRNEEGKMIPPQTESRAEEGSLQAQDGFYTLEQMEKMEAKDLLVIVNADTDMMEAMETIPGKNTNKKLREIIFAAQHNRLAEHVAPYLADDAPQTGDEQPTTPASSDIQPNKNFDAPASSVKPRDEIFDGPAPSAPAPAGNKYGLVVPGFDNGEKRDFATTKALFNKLMGVMPQITSPRYLDLAEKLGILKKYPDKEQFCMHAEISEINDLLNAN